MKKKTNISVSGVQVAAFRVGRSDYTLTGVVKKTKSGHYFLNFYIDGFKQLNAYKRISGQIVAKYLEVTFEQLNNKLFDSTATIENRKRLSKIMNYPRSAA